MKRFLFLFCFLVLFPVSAWAAEGDCYCVFTDDTYETYSGGDTLTDADECYDACNDVADEENKTLDRPVYDDGDGADFDENASGVQSVEAEGLTPNEGGAAEELEASEERRKEVKARAEDFANNGLCQCYCGQEGVGAAAVGDGGFKTSSACREQCEAGGQEFVVCAIESEEAPLANPICWAEDDCESDGGVWDTDTQPYQCAPSRHYCYPAPTAISLNVDIGAFTEVSDVGTYVNAIYTYGLGAAALIAIVLIMIGGAQYILGSGLGSIEAGKKRIVNAVTGLVILLAAFLLLNTVNPYLVNWKTLEVPKIKPTAFLTGSSCEDYDALNYVVDPVSEKDVYCGYDGMVTSSPDGVEMTQSCVYEDCTMTGEFCMNNNSEYECMSCEDTITAAQKGLAITSSLCASFPTVSDSGGSVSSCLFVDAASALAERLNYSTDFCGAVQMNCQTLTDCTQYQQLNMTVKGSEVPVRMYPGAVERLCTQNLCEVPGGCTYSAEDAERSVLAYDEAHPACTNASSASESSSE